MNDRNKVAASTIEQAKSDIVGVISKYVDLKKSGSEYSACCPFHQERTPSFTVKPDKQFYYCFGCGASGDAVDFVQQFESVSFREAVQRIVGNAAVGNVEPVQRQSSKQVEEPVWTPVVPVPADIKHRPMDTFHRRKGDTWERLTSSKRWEYRDANGALIGLVCRFELPGGGKDVLPQSFCVNSQTGEMSWRWMSFAKPRPLYGLDKLAKHSAAQVIVVEGEKTADAAQALFEAAGISRDKLVVVSWPGGGKAVKFTNWAALAGRAVALWPDADQKPYPDNHPKAGQLVPFLDQPGTVCMLDIAQRLAELAKTIKIITPPAGVPDGWDLADALPAGFNLLAHTKTAAVVVEDFIAQHTPAEPDPVADLEAAMEHVTPPWDDIPADAYAEPQAPGAAPAAEPPAPAQAKAPVQAESTLDESDHLLNNGYFTILGYDEGDYYFFLHEKRQIMRRTKTDFTDTGLIEMAPCNWWEESFPAANGGIDKKAACNWIFRTANGRGIYDPTRVRGRGAWLDDGRLVFHHGRHLSVDGRHVKIEHMPSTYVYPMGRQMPTPAAEQLTDEEGEWLISVAQKARWSMPGSAALLSGFAMLAPICGALSWRPHIWLTGGPGSGKSTIQNKFLASLLDGLCVYAQGNSTEPGIRQELKADAIPVLIDEAESNNEGDKKRVENIISLIRQASSGSQAKTLKGTATGDGQSYHIQSMFCMASINVNLPGKADIDRLTKLVLRAPVPGTRDHWEKLESELNQIEQDRTISSRLLARALNMMPILFDAIRVFRAAAAEHFGTQRQGDQFGTLLAGCWCLQKSRAPSKADAMVLIKGYDWKEHLEDHDQDDAQRALTALLDSKLRVGTMGEYSVFELVRESSVTHRHGIIEVQVADDTLRRHGIRAEHAVGELWFGTSVSNLITLVKGMSFVTDLRGQLLRVKGAQRLEGTKKFNGSNSKVVTIPLATILGEDPEEPPI